MNYSEADRQSTNIDDRRNETWVDRAVNRADHMVRTFVNGMLGGAPDYIAAALNTLVAGGTFRGNLRNQLAATTEAMGTDEGKAAFAAGVVTTGMQVAGAVATTRTLTLLGRSVKDYSAFTDRAIKVGIGAIGIEATVDLNALSHVAGREIVEQRLDDLTTLPIVNLTRPTSGIPKP